MTSPTSSSTAEPIRNERAPETSQTVPLDLGGLAWSITILVLTLALAAVGYWIAARSRESAISLLFALGIVTIGMTVALVVGWIGAGRSNAIAATLFGNGVRFGLPLFALVSAQEGQFAAWFRAKESGFLTQILGLYLVGLLVETALVYRRAFRFTNRRVSPSLSGKSASSDSGDGTNRAAPPAPATPAGF